MVFEEEFLSWENSFQLRVDIPVPCEPSWAEWFNPGYPNLLLRDYERYIRKIMDAFPFYSQCFLMLGLSLERWVYVCRPHSVKSLLNWRNRVILLTVVISLTLITAGGISIDYAVNQQFDVNFFVFFLTVWEFTVERKNASCALKIKS